MSSPSPTAEASTPHQRVSGNFVGRDLNVAARDNVTNYLTGLRHLRPRRANPEALMPRNRFVVPKNFEYAVHGLNSKSGNADGARIIVLIAPESHGRKSAALRLLAETGVSPSRVFELLPDWDDPDVSCLPTENNSGYFLNLRGVTRPLPDVFHSDLVEYASELRKAESYMVITATESVWKRGVYSSYQSGILVAKIGIPNAIEVAKKHLESKSETADRSAWIDDSESVFSNLLPADSAPSEAVRLASLIAESEDSMDEDRLDEYHGWETHLTQWFSGGEDRVEERAVRIAGAFLNQAPASVVLDSADILLNAPEINWQPPRGGLLSRPDAQNRLRPADISFDPSNGIASLKHESQGPAILKYLWANHTQLTVVLTRWLQGISQGPANSHLQILATSLTKLAETVGISPVLTLADDWLQSGRDRHIELVGDILSDLATHPVLGSRVRAEMARWADGKLQPLRQRAVARACSSSFGKTYPSQALTRARYILNSPGSQEAQKEATDAIRSLATAPEVVPVVVDTVVKWVLKPGNSTEAGRRIFFDVFSVNSTDDQLGKTPLEIALELDGDLGKAVCGRFLEAWQHIIGQGEGVTEISSVLLNWRQGAEDQRLPESPVVDIIIALGRSTGIFNPPIKDVVSPDGPLKDSLIAALFAEVERTYGPAPNSTYPSKGNESTDQELGGSINSETETQ